MLVDPNGKQARSNVLNGNKREYLLGGELTMEPIGNGETFNDYVYAQVLSLNKGNATLPALYTVKYTNGKLIDKNDMDYSTNCFGCVLTGGVYLIPGGDVGKYLKASGYQEMKGVSNYKEGDVYLWKGGGHIMEAVKKDGKLVWESYFAGDEKAYYGSLKDILLYNRTIGGMSDLKDAKLYRPVVPDVKDKMYESVDVKDQVDMIKEFNSNIGVR
ncbi:hypothetical protein [Apibacter sp. HY039]|uniref:hypothetical protein n=1 Tax=Apibacter sp. HY039 TaxID=2501476 RepID=UPI000FEBC694|nr:hypothetical protein [Apibacter sp. HY039]